MYSCCVLYACPDEAPAFCVPAKLNGGGVPEWNDCFSYDCSSSSSSSNGNTNGYII